jgi:nitrilase
MGRIIAAAVQATPVFMDRDATVERASERIAAAAREGAELIVFPETFVPGYPDWVWRAPAWEGPSAELYARLLENAVEIPGPATEALGKAAKLAKAWVSIGVNEREPGSGTLYNTQVMLSPEGTVAGKHRKLVPTGGERLVWGMGDGSTLEVYDTPAGRVGGLICWENYMPLARAAMYAKGPDIWLAPTWAQGDRWVAPLRHIAMEGRQFVIGVGSLIRGSDLPDDLPGRKLWGGEEDWLNRGYSTIVGPDGDILAGPLIGEAGILTAEVDPSAARASRHEFDAVGHYSRPDVFRLVVDEEARQQTWPTVQADTSPDA